MNRLRVCLLRHGAASHLLTDYNEKVSYDSFIKLLSEWDKASLTPIGKKEVADRVADLKNNYSHLLYSPLKRTKQSAKPFLSDPHIIATQAIPELKEIKLRPPKVLASRILKIKYWIFSCILRSIYTLKIIHYMKQARSILNGIDKTGEDTLVISHQARILTILMYCLFSFKWRILKADTNTAGICIIAKKLSKRKNSKLKLT